MGPKLRQITSDLLQNAAECPQMDPRAKNYDYLVYLFVFCYLLLPTCDKTLIRATEDELDREELITWIARLIDFWGGLIRVAVSPFRFRPLQE